jgi:hypothetical protein
MTDAPLIRPGLASGSGVLAGPGPAGGRLIGWRAIGETEISVEALLEIIGTVFESIFEWRKERAERGDGAQETVVIGGQQGGQQDSQPAGDPYSYQLGGRPDQQAASQGTSSRRGIRQ